MTAKAVMDERALADLERELATEGFAALGEEVYALAVEDAPVLTGHLRDSMYVAVYHDGALVWSKGPVAQTDVQGEGVELFVGNAAEYARYVHDGTVDTPQHPFLARALAIVTPRIAGLVGTAWGHSS